MESSQPDPTTIKYNSGQILQLNYYKTIENHQGFFLSFGLHRYWAGGGWGPCYLTGDSRRRMPVTPWVNHHTTYSGLRSEEPDKRCTSLVHRDWMLTTAMTMCGQKSDKAHIQANCRSSAFLLKHFFPHWKSKMAPECNHTPVLKECTK